MRRAVVLTLLVAALGAVLSGDSSGAIPATLYLRSTASAVGGAWTLDGFTDVQNSTTGNIAVNNLIDGDWYVFAPGTKSSTQIAALPSTPDQTGWVFAPGSATDIPAGSWSFTVRTLIPGSAPVVGGAVLAVGMWKGTVSGGVFTPTGAALIPPADDPANQNLRSGTLITRTVTYPGVPAISLAPGEVLFVEYWRHQLAGLPGGSSADRELDLVVNDWSSYITPPTGGGGGGGGGGSGPTHALSVNALTGRTLFNSGTSTLYYNGTNAGSFTVGDAITDSAGPKQVTYPLVSASGWTHAAETVSTAPSFTSSTYSWAAGSTTSPGAQSIVGENNSSQTSTATLTITNDTTPPGGQTVSLLGGPTYSTLSVPLTLANGSDTGAGIDTASGLVERAGATLSGSTCGTFGSYATVTLVSGADTSVVAGNCYRYRYSISDLVGNQSTPSASSADAMVTSTATGTGTSGSGTTTTTTTTTITSPSGMVTVTPPTEVTSPENQYWGNGTLWFRPAGGGSFRLNATASSASGITQGAFPSVASTTGWTGSGGAVTTIPYTSSDYTWAAGATAPGSVAVTGTNGAGTSDTATIAIAADSAAPSGQSVALVGGPWFTTTSVPLTLTQGTDGTGSGVDRTRDVVERATAPLRGGQCGAYGTYTAVTLIAGIDSTVSGACYRYQFKTTDNVGNVAAASSATTDAKVDATPPTKPVLTFAGMKHTSASDSFVYYDPDVAGGFTVSAASTDPEAGIASYSLPTIGALAMLGSGASRTYTYSTAPSGPLGPYSVTATSNEGLVSTPATFTLVPDSAAPTVTVRCNNAPCRSTVYPNAVSVSITANDGVGSGVGTIRYSLDATSPTAQDGTEYLNALSVRSLTQLKIRAYDKVGNASLLVTVTVRSNANRISFAAPTRLNVRGPAKYVQARLNTSRRVVVNAVLSGPGLRSAQRWRFILPTGTSIVQLRLPWSLMRTGRYTLVWRMTAGSLKATRTSHLYRLAARR